MKHRVQQVIQNNQLSGSIPAGIGQMTHLFILQLEGNQLTGSIPAEIGQLPLPHFSCQNNFLSLDNLSEEITSNRYYSQWELTPQFNPSGSEEGDREALIALYNATGGANWTNNTNWCSERPLREWYGVCVNIKNRVSELALRGNQLIGSIPTQIGQLTNLTALFLYENQLTGSIPTEIGNMTRLTDLQLWKNQLTGFIPTEIGQMTCLTKIDLNQNQLTGSIPASIGQLTNLTNVVLSSNQLSGAIPPEIGQLTNLTQLLIYSNQLTGSIPAEMGQMTNLEEFHCQGNYLDVVNLPTEITSHPYYSQWQLTPQLNYESTDYSSDGVVTTLQTATSGSGINIILMGDGFTDRDIADGKYDAKMRIASEHFFDEEPVKSMRNRFNVYSITAVSKNGFFSDETETAFSGYFGEGTFVGGDNNKVFQYAKYVPGITDSELTKSIVIVIMNASAYAGTCFMFYDNSAIVYFPYGTDNEMFGQLLNHEAVGHGFGKLLDEYSYTGTIPQDDIDAYLSEKGLGWGMNVDITNDPETINWSHFLNDSRYTGQVGIYEGALTWEFGAWRPTDNSIMRYNTGGFNAPSREAIYKRIIELSGGTYSYEDFVAYDAINRTSGASSVRKAQSAKVNPKTFVPLHKPIIIKKSHDQK